MTIRLRTIKKILHIKYKENQGYYNKLIVNIIYYISGPPIFGVERQQRFYIQ